MGPDEMKDPSLPPASEQLQAWYGSALGAAVGRLECACAQRLLANVFGYYLVQIGSGVGFAEALSASKIRARILLTESLGTAVADHLQIVAEPGALPLASESVDAILLPHVLEHCDQPQAILAEVERVLIPEGRLVVIGFNPLSLWGMNHLWWRGRSRPPGRFHLAAQVERWLNELGFMVEVREHALFCSPLGRVASTIESLGRRFWAPLGGIYAIRAVKRVAPLTPIKPYRLKRRLILPDGVVRPTVRS